jgi:hypothetical protein
MYLYDMKHVIYLYIIVVKLFINKSIKVSFVLEVYYEF